MVLSNVLQQEASTLTKLHLHNVGIVDEDVEILTDSLKYNTSLTDLDLGENNITDRGFLSILKLLNDVSSIENTYNSNHTLTDLLYYGVSKKIERLILSALLMNRRNSDNAQIGKTKVILTQLNSANKMELANVQGIEYSYESLFSEVDPVVLPEVLSLVERNCTRSELFRMLVAVVPDLSSLVNKPVAIKELMEMDEQKDRIKDNRSDKSVPWIPVRFSLRHDITGMERKSEKMISKMSCSTILVVPS